MSTYWVRTGSHRWRPTEHAGGAWSLDEQHIGPSLGLLTHLVERDRDARRSDGLAIGRLTFDILGTMPLAEVDVAVRVVRPGRTIELVEATLSHGGRAVLVLRAWLIEQRDTDALAGVSAGIEPLPAPETLDPWDPSELWAGGFIASVEARRHQVEPGRAQFWLRTEVSLVDDAEPGPLARAAGLWDVANGMSVRADPRKVAFPNLDLSAHLFRQPGPGWVGFDTTVSFGPRGIGETASRLHDVDGPVGTSAQILTLRPR